MEGKENVVITPLAVLETYTYFSYGGHPVEASCGFTKFLLGSVVMACAC